MTLLEDALLSAATVEHPWDCRALEWDGLEHASIVVEVGGYRGRWALQMARRYWPQLYVYEPQPWAYTICRELLQPYGAFVLNYGLGVRDEELPMSSYETDGATVVDGDGPLIELRDAVQVLPKSIDLMLMNIEGYEYTLLPYLIDRARLPERLMVQWHRHRDKDGAHERLIGRLEQTHERLWDYGDVLMAWGRM